MIVLEILDIRQFMNKLLKQTTFDDFEVHKINASTNITFQVDGHLNKEFLDSDERESLNDQHYIKWNGLKSSVYNMIKGERPPTQLKIIFSLSKEATENLLEKVKESENAKLISGFFINIHYENKLLKVITGTNYKSFTIDKSIEHYFDETIIRFFTKHQILVKTLQ